MCDESAIAYSFLLILLFNSQIECSSKGCVPIKRLHSVNQSINKLIKIYIPRSYAQTRDQHTGYFMHYTYTSSDRLLTVHEELIHEVPQPILTRNRCITEHLSCRMDQPVRHV